MKFWVLVVRMNSDDGERSMMLQDGYQLPVQVLKVWVLTTLPRSAKHLDSPNSLLLFKHPIGEVYNLSIFKNLASEFLEGLMSWVVIDIVISIRRTLKFNHECMRHAILNHRVD